MERLEIKFKMIHRDNDGETKTVVFQNNFSIPGTFWLQYIGFNDMNGKEIFVGDILTNGDRKFRVYSTEGGFAIKAWPWAKDIEDEKTGDSLIFIPCAQTQSFIHTQCWVSGNIYESWSA